MVLFTNNWTLRSAKCSIFIVPSKGQNPSLQEAQVIFIAASVVVCTDTSCVLLQLLLS